MIIPPDSIDPLTGLPTRHRFQRRLVKEYARAKQLGLPLSLIAIDLDGFAEVNARFLLPGGDKLLAAIARVISSIVTEADVLARDGGDQFSLILPGRAIDAAHAQAERIRLAIAQTAVEYCGQVVAVTASIGVTTASFMEQEPWDMFLRARDAIRRAKELGKNRVVVG